jgi:general L-amino acid transport system substrate-binding protein
MVRGDPNRKGGGTVRSRRSRWWFSLVLALVLVGAACSGDDDGDEGADGSTTTEPSRVTLAQDTVSVLETVRDRGTLNCGVNDAVPGFGFVDESGEFSGFDIDFCRAIAAAVLGDAEAVEFKPLTAEQRFTALQSGEIDVLVRNTTWTSTRDGAEGAAFVTTTFYDGQGMMVRSDAGFGSIDDMAGTTICVLSGTTTELNLATRFNAAGLDFTPLSFEDNDTLREAFLSDQCDGWTSDKSQLAAHRSTFPEAEGGPEALVIMEETFSKEPLGPVVRDGDSKWFDAVNWAVIATIQAEEFGITSENVQDMLGSDNADIQRFLGQPTGEDNAVFDPGLDLEPDFVVDVVEQVGNYAEIYDRNVGADSPLELARELNALWTDGGLLYAPPYR